MAKQKRWQYKRVLDQAVNDCSRAMSNLEKVEVDYKELHPEYSSAASSIMRTLLQCMENINWLRDAI